MNHSWAKIAIILSVIALAQTRARAETAETLAARDIKAGAANFKGSINEADPSEEEKPITPLFQKYGTRTFTTFKKHPEIVASLKKLNPKFDPHTMQSSGVNSIATFDNRTLLILEGCYPHNCGGTQQIVAFEPATKRVYLLEPTNVGPDTEPSGKFNLYGNPDSLVRAAMFKAYPDES